MDSQRAYKVSWNPIARGYHMFSSILIKEFIRKLCPLLALVHDLHKLAL